MERRRDRYRIIYTWKQLEHLVPQCNIREHLSDRRGRLLQPSQITRKNVNSYSFNNFAPLIWNKLPYQLRNITGVNINKNYFKRELDKFLMTVEDNPHLPNQGPRRCDNDLVSAIGCKMEENRRMGRAPLSTKC